VRVGPLANVAGAQFTVVAYDPARFTTVQNNENIIGGPATPPQISDSSFDPVTREFSLLRSAPAGW